MTLALSLALAGVAALAVVVVFLARSHLRLGRDFDAYRHLTATSILAVQGALLKGRAGMTTGRYARPTHASDAGLS